jgi:hypothetical protein
LESRGKKEGKRKAPTPGKALQKFLLKIFKQPSDSTKAKSLELPPK